MKQKVQQSRSQIKSNARSNRSKQSFGQKSNKSNKRHIQHITPEMKLAIKMGGDYYPDYYTERGDFKGERYDREDLGFYRSCENALDMGLISQVPVREGLVKTLGPQHLRNPYELINRAIEDNNSTRHYSLGSHRKQHLFGSEKASKIAPRQQELYKDTNFEMENEVFPTNFIKKKNEIYGSNKTFEKPFTGMKTYHGDEIQPYMRDKLGEYMQTENIAKYHFNNLNHREQYNQNLLASHRSLQKEEQNSTQFSRCTIRSDAGEAVRGVHYRPYEWKIRDVNNQDITNSNSNNTHMLPYEMRSTKALQRSGSNIALSQASSDFGNHSDFRHIPSSVTSVTKSIRSKSHRLLPPKSEYYYLSNYKNANRLKALDEDRENESSDDDYLPTVYPENRYLASTMKI